MPRLGFDIAFLCYPLSKLGPALTEDAAWSLWAMSGFEIGQKRPVRLTAGATVFVVEDSRLSASPDVRLRLI